MVNRRGIISQAVSFIKKYLTKFILLLQQYNLCRIISRFILYRNICYRISEEKDGYKFLGLKNKQVIASVSLNYYENNPHPGWWICYLEVRLLYRRLGIGKELVKRAIAFIREKGAQILYLNVNKENHVAIRLYEDFGFRMIPGSERFDEKSKQIIIYMAIDLGKAL